MSFSNPLQTKLGRLATFFFLYMAEGLPHGFATVAMAAEMRARGVSPGTINQFVAVILLPWSWKWAIGPLVDVFYSDRLGRRRMWIVMAQAMMILTLMASTPVSFSMEIRLLTVLLLVTNIFSATQDVAIDALACGVLKEDERGLANGLMFGGAHTGNIIGGAGVLLLSRYAPFHVSFLFISGCLLAITLLVSLRLKEPAGEETRAVENPKALTGLLREIRGYVFDAVHAMFGNRPAFVGMLFALLPTGAYALALPLQTTLPVEFGMDHAQIANLMFVTGIVWVVACVIGGFLSDRFGRKRVLAVCCLGTVLPTIWLAVQLRHHGWIMPVDVKPGDGPVAPEALIAAFWVAVLAFNVFNGLIYGVRTALFMDVTSPAVAATQFTAYMSLLNVVISYSSYWQGKAADNLGYPATLTIDAVVGLACIALLPWMTRPRSREDPA